MTPDVHTLTGAYAVHALDDVERRRFERHLAECSDCTREVAELRATAARLGLAVSEQPPERLKQRVLSEVARTRQAPPGRGQDGSRAPRQWGLRLTAAAAAVALVAAVAFGVVALRTQHQLDAAQRQIAQAETRFGPVAEVFAEPDTRVTTESVGSATAVVMASRTLNKAVLMVTGMPAAPSGHTYQAWVIDGGTARSVGLLVPGSDAAIPPVVFGGLTGSDQLGVTVEPAGGSRQPTTKPIMQFSVSV